MSLTSLIAFSFVSFLISFLLFPVMIKIFTQIKWFDAPGTHKIHRDSVPSMGGVVILISALLTLLIGLPLQNWISLKYFFVSVALMFLIGLRDDVLALSPRQKLFSQFLPVFVLVFLDNATLTSLYGLVETGNFPQPLSYIITLFTVIIITNAYNLIDGIDGLAGTIGSIALIFFGVWFYLAGQPYLSIVALSFAGALMGFLFFNWQPSSIFMGDTGALMVGLILSYFAIRFINLNYELPADSVVKFRASISTGICVLIIPIFDTLRVIILRLKSFKSPFRADRNHLHHRLLAFGMPHSGAVKWMLTINIGFILLALAMKPFPDTIILPIVAMACLMISFVLKRTEKSTQNL